MRDIRIVKWLAVGVAIAVGSLRFAPQALAFPYVASVGDTKVFSETPIDAVRLASLLVTSDRKLRASTIYSDAYPKNLFLTQGGWRWLLLAPASQDAFAVSFALSPGVIINRADIEHDLVTTGAAIAGRRSLSAVIAHERAHGLLRARFGVLADVRYPEWLREGYCEYVAQESSLTDDEAKVATASRSNLPALAYYDGRKRVAHELAALSVVELFDRNRRF